MSEKLYKQRDFLYQAYWIEKLSLYEIASICNCVYSTVQRWFKKYNIPTRGKTHGLLFKLKRKHKDTLFNKDFLYQAYWVQKLSITEIANLIGVSFTPVYRQLRENNISIRNISQSMKIAFAKNNKIYKNIDFLYQAYFIEKLSAREISNICKVSKTTILKWLKKYFSSIRSNSNAKKISMLKNDDKIKEYLTFKTNLAPQDIPQSLVEIQREKLKLKYTAEGII